MDHPNDYSLCSLFGIYIKINIYLYSRLGEAPYLFLMVNLDFQGLVTYKVKYIVQLTITNRETENFELDP